MLNQRLQQKLLQKLSPQQIQLMKMLQLPTVALEERIKEEIETNPALEEGSDENDADADELQDESFDEGTHDEDHERDDFAMSDYMDDDDGALYKLQVKNTGPDDDRKEVPFASGVGFHDVLESQLGMCALNDKQHQIAEYLIGNIDDDGYLRRDLNSVVDDIAFSQNIHTTEAELLSLLRTIQEFDPAGVGARTLQECLLIQLQRKHPKTEIVEMAIKVVQDMMDEFSKKHYDKIEKKLNVNPDVLKNVIHEILKLNPKPGSSAADTEKTFQQITPDFTISNNEGELEISLNSRNAPALRVSKDYQAMLATYTKNKEDRAKKQAALFVKQKIDDAKWFMDAIQQRQETLLITMQAIMEYQHDYFLEGDETKLRPMILKDIAEKVGLDISTISRVANSKYVQTHFGTFLIKSFFSESLSTDSGEEVSTREVKKILSNCVGEENKKKPITDDALAKILKEKGYNIARRTIAKYREQLDIPVARLRKEL
ncbi:MAG: RNA polymerase factor sigma-54 [Bacteroidia bacterium]